MKDEMKSMYIACASGLHMGNFTNVKTGPERTALIDKIANMYCEATDNGDELIRSQTISALMLLFWGEISKMAEKCKAVSELEYDDFASKLYECINTACEYRAWKDSTHTAEACIRSVISSRGAAAILYESNLDKNKANVNNCSLDATVNDSDDSATTRLDLIEDEAASQLVSDISVSSFIQSYLDRNKVVEGIILDTIVNNDCQRYKTTNIKKIDEETGKEERITKTSSKFWSYQVVQILSKLPDDYFNYFKSKYVIQDVILKQALADIKKTSSTGLYKCLAKTLASAKVKYLS